MRRLWIGAILALGVGSALVANLLINHYGPTWTPYVAFGLIGVDLVVRDKLHLDLNGLQRWCAIGALIALGSLATYLVNRDAGTIALASVSAFAAALVVDTAVFAAAAPLGAQKRVNVSNAFAAGTDTLVFFAIAFGLSAVPFFLIFAQWCAKGWGGALWGTLMVRERPAELYEPSADHGLLARDA